MQGNGSVTSTVKIGEATANSRSLGDWDYFGSAVTGIGDLNEDGVNDLVVGVFEDDTNGNNRGALHTLFMNTDGSVISNTMVNIINHKIFLHGLIFFKMFY